MQYYNERNLFNILFGYCLHLIPNTGFNQLLNKRLNTQSKHLNTIKNTYLIICRRLKKQRLCNFKIFLI